MKPFLSYIYFHIFFFLQPNIISVITNRKEKYTNSYIPSSLNSTLKKQKKYLLLRTLMQRLDIKIQKKTVLPVGQVFQLKRRLNKNTSNSYSNMKTHTYCLVVIKGIYRTGINTYELQNIGSLNIGIKEKKKKKCI